MSNFTLRRYDYKPLTTLGKLEVSISPRKMLEAFVLEDAVRSKQVKIKSWTAIPEGKYNVKLYDSPTFGFVPCIYNKELGVIEKNGHTWNWVLMHGGNRHEDTDGCLLVAKNNGNEVLKLSGKKESEINAHMVWGACVDEIVKMMVPGEVYSMEIINL